MVDRVQTIKQLQQYSQTIIAIVCLVLCAGAVNAFESEYDELLQQAHQLRSANPQKSLAIINAIDREALSPLQKDKYDFISAYSLFINGDITGSIASFKALSKRASSKTEKFIAQSALLNLYSGTQNWSAGFKVQKEILEQLPTIENTEAIEQAQLGIINFYNGIGERELIVDYAEPLLKGQFSLRFTCFAGLQWITARVLIEHTQLDDAFFGFWLDRCETLDEQIITLGIYHQLATFYMKSDQTDKALMVLETHIEMAEQQVYQAMISEFYDLLAQNFLKNEEYAKAEQYARSILQNGNLTLAPIASISAHEVLYKVAVHNQQFKQALEHYKNYIEAKTLNVDQENTKQLTIQKAKRDSEQKVNQIALLDRENSLLKANARLDEETAQNRVLIILFMLTILIFVCIFLYKKRSNYIKFREISRKDGLTGIANRLYFTNKANEYVEFCEEKQSPIGFIIFDLDNFKRINDEHGHKMGDLALQLAVNAAQESCRDADLIGRLGGEEFGIILRDCSVERTLEVAEACRVSIEQVNEPKQFSFNLSASFGVTNSTDSGYSFDNLFEAADTALYDAKDAGKNTINYR